MKYFTYYVYLKEGKFLYPCALWGVCGEYIYLLDRGKWSLSLKIGEMEIKENIDSGFWVSVPEEEIALIF